MEIGAVSAQGVQGSASHSLMKGAMEMTANSVLTMLKDMPKAAPAPSFHRMDIRA